jgi:hypothetical protein
MGINFCQMSCEVFINFKSFPDHASVFNDFSFCKYDAALI